MPYKPRLFHSPPAEAEARGKRGIPPYVLDMNATVAIDVALATGRPLLVSGPPGCGKTTLAQLIAACQGWRYLAHTVTSRTRLDDLLAEFDTLQRLNDAQLGKDGNRLLPDWCYLRPGKLWWAFDRASAGCRGATKTELAKLKSAGQDPPPPPIDPSEGTLTSKDVVVLLDEIDKADPDLPNDLLEPLDRRRFQLPVGGREPVTAPDDRQVMLVITTNGERELPPAFLRRCVVLNLPEHSPELLVDIAKAHFGEQQQALFKEIANKVVELRKNATADTPRLPSTAEYLDAVKAVIKIDTLRQKDTWQIVERLLLLKSDKAAAGS